MDWSTINHAGLGPPRPDEPADLRRDIADEIADHLECALRRELRRTDDESAARAAVLDRFGNPQRIARQLWWLAMKEKIMKDRIMLSMVALLAVVGICTCAFAWSALQQNRETNLALLTALREAKAQPSPATHSLDWSHLMFHCVNNMTDRKPVAGVWVQVSGPLINPAQPMTINHQSDPQGKIDFGLVRPGQYRFFNETLKTSSASIVVQPGKDFDGLIVCPPEVSVRTEMLVPAELAGLTISLGLSTDGSPRDDTSEMMPTQTYAMILNAVSARATSPSNGTEVLASGEAVVCQGIYKLNSVGLYAKPEDFRAGQPVTFLTMNPVPKPLYEARPNGTSVWKVEFPPGMIDELRLRMKAKKRDGGLWTPPTR